MGYERDSTTSSSSETAVSDLEIDGAPDATPANEEGDIVGIHLSDMEEARGDVHRTASGEQKIKRKRQLSMIQRLDQRKRLAEANAERREVEVAVVEQRVSNLAQGCLCGLRSSFALQRA